MVVCCGLLKSAFVTVLIKRCLKKKKKKRTRFLLSASLCHFSRTASPSMLRGLQYGIIAFKGVNGAVLVQCCAPLGMPFAAPAVWSCHNFQIRIRHAKMPFRLGLGVGFREPQRLQLQGAGYLSLSSKMRLGLRLGFKRREYLHVFTCCSGRCPCL